MVDLDPTIENFKNSDNFYMIVGMMITTIVVIVVALSLSLSLSGMFWDQNVTWE
jgi:hypothetical protein